MSSPAPLTASRWTCAKCAVSVGRIDGTATDRPANWMESREEIYCLSCSRALAADGAVAGAADASPADRARIRRRALIEFELERDPGASDRRIAEALHTSTATVTAIRDSQG